MSIILHRTRAGLAVATFAVLVAAFFVARDFVRDVFPRCPGSLVIDDAESVTGFDPRGLDRMNFVDPDVRWGRPAYSLVRDTHSTMLSLVRTESLDLPSEAPCECGKVRIGPEPDRSTLELYARRARELYLVEKLTFATPTVDRPFRPYSVVAAFHVTNDPTWYFQASRVLSGRHLPCLVVAFALAALLVAWRRLQLPAAYAAASTWKEARLTPQGRVENEFEGFIGTLDPALTRSDEPWPIASGPVLVSAEMLTAGLYRDAPVISCRQIVEGGHERWRLASAVRLRDARAIGWVSFACTALGIVARALGG